MKAVILAAGKGTRMGDLTHALPKPMLRVHGKPILQHIVEGLAACNIHDICIITGWQADVIESYFQNGAPWNVHIQYVRQEVQDGTGKAPELAKDFIQQSDFLLTYGDILVKPETYQSMRHRYEQRSPAGLLTVTLGEDVTKGGLNFFDEQFRLKKLVEKPSQTQLQELRNTGWLLPHTPIYYNAGIYIFQPSLFHYTARLTQSPRGEYELTDAISNMIQDNHEILGLPIEGRWVDIRDPEILQNLEKNQDW